MEMTMKRKFLRHFGRKTLALLVVALFTASALSITASAAILGSDTTDYFEVFGTPSTGCLYVYDTHAYATTVYSRFGSNIYINARIDATYRCGGKDHYIVDYSRSDAGGTTATVYLPLEDCPNAVFLRAQGSHEVSNYTNGVLLPGGYWLDYTSWVR